MGAWLRGRSDAVIDSLIGALVLALWGVVYARGVPGFVVVLPFVIGCAAVAVVHWLRRRDRTRRDVQLHAEPTDDVRLALSRLRTPDPLLLDVVHRFSQVTQAFRIRGQDGVFELDYAGTNVSKRPSYCFREALAGDSPMDLRDLNISAHDPTDGLQLTWSALVDEPYRKIIEVRFRRPVLPGESFRLALSCTWRGTFTRPRDYIFFLAGHRRRGVDVLHGKLILSRPPAFFEGIYYDGRQLVTAPSQPTATVQQDGSCTVVWSIDGVPARDIPIIDFQRTDHADAARALPEHA
ncbi:hypothetical protein [Micromonospora sp. NPDC049374]|uniref:hypothetical protein n=1 Tax=Micromonospora sp. NPDC049374 TaxID=3154352 RepID=UPI00343AF42F